MSAHVILYALATQCVLVSVIARAIRFVLVSVIARAIRFVRATQYALARTIIIGTPINILAFLGGSSAGYFLPAMPEQVSGLCAAS